MHAFFVTTDWCLFFFFLVSLWQCKAGSATAPDDQKPYDFAGSYLRPAGAGAGAGAGPAGKRSRRHRHRGCPFISWVVVVVDGWSDANRPIDEPINSSSSMEENKVCCRLSLVSSRHLQTRAFSFEKWKLFRTVALSFVCNKYYPIID